MINLQLDLGNVPSVLQRLGDPRLAAKAAKHMAESYTDDIHNWIDAGHAFEVSAPNQLAQNINWRPLSDGAEVYVNSAMHQAQDEQGRDLPMQELAHYLEFGTGEFAGHRQWVIRPREGRKGLKIPVSGGGGYVIRRAVVHKGSRAFPFFFADQQNRVNNMLAAARLVINNATAGVA